jgi:hypothetical protein
VHHNLKFWRVRFCFCFLSDYGSDSDEEAPDVFKFAGAKALDLDAPLVTTVQLEEEHQQALIAQSLARGKKRRGRAANNNNNSSSSQATTSAQEEYSDDDEDLRTVTLDDAISGRRATATARTTTKRKRDDSDAPIDDEHAEADADDASSDLELLPPAAEVDAATLLASNPDLRASAMRLQ